MTANFKYFFSIDDFPNSEAAEVHLRDHCATETPKLAEEFGSADLDTIKSLIPEGGAHYYAGKWRIYREILDYTTGKPSGERITRQCPKCKRLGFYERSHVTQMDVWLHYVGVRKNGEQAEVDACYSKYDRSGLIDASY